jgi:hypothetical protein
VKSSTSTPVARAVAVAALAVVGITGLYYVFSPVPPYGFYYDLGANIAAVSHIARWMQGFADVWDSLGWAGWGERTAFTYAPMTAYVAAVPLAKIFGGDAFTAVKAMQVLDFAVAWGSAAYLYAALRGRTAWAWIAGMVYALLPYQLLMIRGNMEFGLVSACAPLLLAWPLVLVRRFGLRALPFCGAVAGLLSADVVVEYGIFAGLPAIVAAVAAAYDRTRRAAWAGYSFLAFVAFPAVAAYTAIPTLASHALFAPPAPVDAMLQGGEFSRFAEGPAALASLLLNESMAHQRPEFSLGPLVWVTLPIGIVLWALAIGWVVRCIRRRDFAPGERALLICAAVCAAISMGAFVPGFGLVWWLIAHLPVIDMVRTPDRFIALAVPMVVVAAVSAIERLARGERTNGLAYGALGAVGAASLALFFIFRIFLGDTYALEERQPHFDRINAVAEARGNRAANLALVDEGSVFDSSLYAMMMPGVDFQEDFTQRYEGDGLGGTGMLARANVATIVASPPWTKDSPLLAQSAVVRSAFLHPITGDATTVAAYGVDPVRGYVHAVEPACLDGGPGMLDYLEVLPAFAADAFLPNGRTCARTLYADSAPAPEILGGPIVASVPGAVLFPHSGVLRDIDYRIALGRFFLNVPWYRNAIDGDSPSIGDGAVSLDPGNAGTATFAVPNAGAYAVAVRAACHGTIAGSLRVDRGAVRPLLCRAAPGFTWTSVPVGRLDAGTHTLSMSVATIDTSDPIAQTTWHFGLDGIALVAQGAAAPAAAAGSQAFAFSAARLATRVSAPEPASLTLAGTTGFEPVPGASGPTKDLMLAREPDAVATYRFSGPAGTYRIAASAYADASVSGGTYLGILNASGCCASISSYSQDRGPELYVEGDRYLRPGDRVAVVLHTDANDPVAVSQLLSVLIDPDPKPAQADPRRSHYGAWFDYVERSRTYNPQIPGGPTPVPGFADLTPYVGLPLWTKPLSLSVSDFPSDTSSSPTAFTASIVGGGSVTVRLSCGSSVAIERLTSPGGDVTLPHASSPNCRADLDSETPGLYLQRASITRAIADLDLRGSRWIAAGTYRVQLVRRGAGAAGGRLVVDGRPAGSVLRVAHGGLHELRWDGAPADAFMLVFVPVSWPVDGPPVETRQDASQRWSIHLAHPATLESAVLSDGNWHLAGTGGSIAGTSCDLENTCFASVPAGDYRLWHSWPGYIVIGFAITLAAWAASGWLLLAVPKRT